MWLQTQAKSVVAQIVALPTASVMQGSEHAGKMLRSWAEAAAARARMAVVYFIVWVVSVLFWGWVENQRESCWCGHLTSVMERRNRGGTILGELEGLLYGGGVPPSRQGIRQASGKPRLAGADWANWLPGTHASFVK
jgi:hypothetical protein